MLTFKNDIVAEAWRDSNFKKRLIEDPKTVLQERGVYVDESKEVIVVQNTKEKVYLVLPGDPVGMGEISGEVDAPMACNTCGTSLPCATY